MERQVRALWWEGVTQVSEFELLQWLRREHDIRWDTDATVALFQQHFVIRHGLYTVQAALQETDIQMEISAVGIRLSSRESTGQSISMDGSAHALAEFYLDERQLFCTDKAQVTAWLDQFWRRFSSQDELDGARSILDVSDTASWTEIQNRYRSLARRHHPDFGGDQTQFVAVREAYEQLKKHYS
ncbi:DNA-J related domain-containing protein [Teredinibacter turnerae]|uniref:DNA-J related domain-containing protein n=1 Tax=Teredinibacter turnerae TaxID=2426 RepID=UPI002257347A|nr:DNA-J related domain-containing protein [Teredinibacter turnerae]